MPYRIRLVGKSDKQAVLGLHECTDIAYRASPGQSGSLLGPSRHFCLGRKSPAFEAASQALGSIWKDTDQ